MIRILDNATFTNHLIKSGQQVGVQVDWQSQGDGDDNLNLHYEADKFTIVRDCIPLPRDAAGSQVFQLKITRLTTYTHCDVNFQFGDTHRQDSVEVA